MNSPVAISCRKYTQRRRGLPSGLPTSKMPTGRQSWGREFWVHHSSGLPTLTIKWFVSTLVEWNNVLKVLKYQPDPSPEILHSLTVNDSTLPRFIIWLDCSDTVVQSQVGSCVKNLTGHQLTDHQLMMICVLSNSHRRQSHICCMFTLRACVFKCVLKLLAWEEA